MMTAEFRVKYVRHFLELSRPKASAFIIHEGDSNVRACMDRKYLQ